MMAAILNSAIMIHPFSTDSLIHSHSTWWWQPSWILPCWIWHCHLGFRHHLLSDSLKNTLTPFWLTQTNSIWLKLIHSHSTWWWQPSWILPSWIQPFAQKKLHSCILTQLDDGSHLEFCHVGFRHCHLGFKHLVIFSQIHSKTLFLHSDSDSN